MKSLLIVAHGSRRETSNQEVAALTRVVMQRTDTTFDLVEYAFLEIAEPSIGDGLRKCIAAGACEIVVFPYFLAAGRHVVADIPNDVAPVQAEHPDVAITIAPHLGESALLVDAILGLSGRAEVSKAHG
ncbi:MAG: CbiX/SirB N-terminal domain-containing protein [Pseudomonadota bacterium]|nr:MAG: CbiX/SirB N-terminal domain-containing protein [Pseudomonadota bacterium]